VGRATRQRDRVMSAIERGALSMGDVKDKVRVIGQKTKSTTPYNEAGKRVIATGIRTMPAPVAPPATPPPPAGGVTPPPLVLTAPTSSPTPAPAPAPTIVVTGGAGMPSGSKPTTGWVPIPPAAAEPLPDIEAPVEDHTTRNLVIAGGVGLAALVYFMRSR